MSLNLNGGIGAAPEPRYEPRGVPTFDRAQLPGTGAAAGTDAVLPNWWNGLRAPSTTSAGPRDASSRDVFAAIARFAGAAQTWLNSLMARIAGGFPPPPPAPPESTFTSADVASVGDPHLSISGTARDADGSARAVDSHADSMIDHADLFDSQDFGDAFRVATSVTQPDARGVTYNQRATASMNGGNDAVTLERDGTLTVVSNGRSVALAPGSSTMLSGGATVARAADGSVTIGETSGSGESLTTTFRSTGAGVDVTAHAAGGVTLGGDIVAQALAPGVGAAQTLVGMRKIP